jgi:hypothetical protein
MSSNNPSRDGSQVSRGRQRPKSEPSRSILIEVVEHRNGKFKAYLGDRLLATSVQPFIAACRELLRLGHPSSAPAVMCSRGSRAVRLHTKRIGDAAGIDTIESSDGRVRFQPARFGFEASTAEAAE